MYNDTTWPCKYVFYTLLFAILTLVEERVFSCDVSRDGSLFVTSSTDGQVKVSIYYIHSLNNSHNEVWNVHTSQQLFNIAVTEQENSAKVSFSRDSTLLFVSLEGSFMVALLLSFFLNSKFNIRYTIVPVES